MGREVRHVEIAITVDKQERLPLLADGGQMYADDVVEELHGVVQAAVATWYEQRGHLLLACEPII